MTPARPYHDAPRRFPGLPRAIGAWAIAALGAWLVAKQLVWSPVTPAPGAQSRFALEASAAVALIFLGTTLRLGGRAQLAVLLLLDAGLTGIVQVHLLYERQFSDLASIAALSFASQSGSVGGAIVALLRWSDLLLWSDVALLGLLTALGVEAQRRRSVANALVASGALLFVPPARALAQRPLTGPRLLAVSRAEVAASLGVVGYQVFDAVTFLSQRQHRSDPAVLDAALAYHRTKGVPSGALTGSQRGRNVIVVQLESMQRFAVGRSVGGVAVTPALDRLARESLTFTSAFTQAAQGTSSDAEFAAGCSLYPLETGAVFTDRYDVKYRCLPAVLRDAGYSTAVLHANWPNFWNRDRMYPAMGYDAFLSIRDFDREPVIGLGLSDERFLQQAVDRIAALPRPFYALVITLSNHAPFDDPRLPHALPLGALAGTYVGAYLDSVHFADAALGEFVERLRATGLLDSSVLVVYGDHAGVARTASGTALLGVDTRRSDAWLQHEKGVPLLVRLPGGASRATRGDPAGQVDIAPTIADLLGVPFEGTFFQGRSLVSDPPRAVVLPDGSAISRDAVYVSPAAGSSVASCLEAGSGTPLPLETCDPLAEHAARELTTSRAEVNGDLFRWMLRSPDRG